MSDEHKEWEKKDIEDFEFKYGHIKFSERVLKEFGINTKRFNNEVK